MPGNVCNTTTRAPGVTPSASSRTARPSTVGSTSTMTPCASWFIADSGVVALELNAKEMKDIVEPSSGQDGDWCDHAEDRHAGPKSTFANHHQKICDTRHEERHHRERDDCLHAGQLPAMRELEQAG